MNLIGFGASASPRSVTVVNVMRPNIGLLVGQIGSGQRHVK
jgi:hypothetical protein